MDFDQLFLHFLPGKAAKLTESKRLDIQYWDTIYVTASTFLFKSILYYFPAPNKEIDFFLLKQLKIATYDLQQWKHFFFNPLEQDQMVQLVAINFNFKQVGISLLILACRSDIGAFKTIKLSLPFISNFCQG